MWEAARTRDAVAATTCSLQRQRCARRAPAAGLGGLGLSCLQGVVPGLTLVPLHQGWADSEPGCRAGWRTTAAMAGTHARNRAPRRPSVGAAVAQAPCPDSGQGPACRTGARHAAARAAKRAPRRLRTRRAAGSRTRGTRAAREAARRPGCASIPEHESTAAPPCSRAPPRLPPAAPSAAAAASAVAASTPAGSPRGGGTEAAGRFGPV